LFVKKIWFAEGLGGEGTHLSMGLSAYSAHDLFLSLSWFVHMDGGVTHYIFTLVFGHVADM
jgi:hypothetical protein